MAIDASELSFIELIFRPIVNIHVEGYREDGYTLEEAWAEFLTLKPEGAHGETVEIMQKMFNDSWTEGAE